MKLPVGLTVRENSVQKKRALSPIYPIPVKEQLLNNNKKFSIKRSGVPIAKYSAFMPAFFRLVIVCLILW
jgi:hypothetical protein